jgi:hypothetical protein
MSITIEHFGPVTRLTLDRPEAANAISIEMALGLAEAIDPAGQVPLRLHHACTSLPLAGEGAGFVNCLEVREEMAVGLLTGADVGESTGLPIATCPACAAEQASLRPVRSLRGLAR